MSEQNDIQAQQKRLDTIDQQEDREVVVGEKKYGDVVFGKVDNLKRKIDTDAGITDERVKALPAFQKLKQDALKKTGDELRGIDEKNIDVASKKLEETLRQLEIKFEKMKELTPLLNTFEKFQKMLGALPFQRDWMTLYTSIDPTKRAPPEMLIRDMEKLMSIGGGYAPAGEMVKHMEPDVVNLMGAYLRGDRGMADVTVGVLGERLAFARRVSEKLPQIKEERKKIEGSIKEYESHNDELRRAIASGRPLDLLKGLERSYLNALALMPALKSMTKWGPDLMRETNGRSPVDYATLLPEEVRKELSFTTVVMDNQGKAKDMPAQIPLTDEAMKKTEDTLQGQLIMMRRGIYLTTKDPAYKGYFEASQSKMTSRLIDDALQYMAETGEENADIKKCIGIVAGNFDSVQRMQPENPVGAAQENSLFQKRIIALKKKLGAGGIDAHANTAGVLGNEMQFIGTGLMSFTGLKERSPKQHEAFVGILNTYLQQSRALSAQMLTQNPVVGEFQHRNVEAKQMFSGLATTFGNISAKIEKSGEGFSELDMAGIKKEIGVFRSRTSYKFLKSSQAMSVLQEMKKYMSDPSLIPPKDLAMIRQAEQSILQSQMALQQIDQTCEQLMAMDGYRTGAKGFAIDSLKVIAKIAAAVAGAVVVGGVITASGGLGIVAAGTGFGEVILSSLATNALIAGGASVGGAMADSVMEQNMNALQKDALLQSWIQGTTMSIAGGAAGSLLGKGMGTLSAKSMQAMQNSRFAAIRGIGTNMEARALKQAASAQAERHTSGNIFRNMMNETKEELLEEGLQNVGLAIAPDDPGLGFLFSLFSTAYGHGKRVEGGTISARNDKIHQSSISRRPLVRNDQLDERINHFYQVGAITVGANNEICITHAGRTLSIPISEENIIRRYRNLFGSDFGKLEEFVEFLDDIKKRPNGTQLMNAVKACRTGNIHVLKALIDFSHSDNILLHSLVSLSPVYGDNPDMLKYIGNILQKCLEMNPELVRRATQYSHEQMFRGNPAMFAEMLIAAVKWQRFHAFDANLYSDMCENNPEIFRILLDVGENDSMLNSIIPTLHATRAIFRGNTQILRAYIDFLRNSPKIDQLGRNIPSLLVAAKNLYGNDVSKFKKILQPLSLPDAQLAYDAVLAKIISAQKKNTKLHELYKRTETMRESVDMIRLIELLLPRYGNDISRLAKALDPLIQQTGWHIAPDDLIRAEPMYGDNMDMFEILLSSLLHHPFDMDAISELIDAKSVYQNDISLFRSFLEIAETGRYHIVKNVAQTLNALKKYPAFFPHILRAAKHEKARIDYVIQFSDIFGDNVGIFEAFIDANISDGIDGMEALAATLKIQSLITGSPISPDYDPEIYQILKYGSRFNAFISRGDVIADFPDFLKSHAGLPSATIVKEYMRFRLFTSSAHNADRENNSVISLFPEYDISKGITRENWMYVLSIYSGSYDGGVIYGDIVSLMETGKNTILDFMNEVRDRALKDGPESLSPHEKAALTNFAHSVPHYKMLERTAQFFLRFIPPPTDADAAYLDSIRVSCLSLFEKFSKRDRVNQVKNINYTHADLASFYEKIDVFRWQNSFTSQLLQTFDSLQVDRENYRLMQDNIMQGFASIATVASNNLSSYMPRLEAIVRELQSQIVSSTDVSQQKVFLETCRKKLDMLLSETFESELGLHNLPPMTPAIMEHITPHVAYLSNINESTPFKRSILSLFILLNTLGKWDAFKKGENIDLSPYLSGDNLQMVQAYLNNRMGYDIFSSFDSDFFEKLVEKTESIMIGESGSIADTIGGIERHIGDLSDLDNFSAIEQKLLGILKKFGSKIVGKSLSERFRNPAYTDEVIADLGVIENEKVALPTLQKITRILGSLLKFQESIGSLDLAAKLKHLEDSVQPSADVVQIFQKIDVDMKSGSGAKPIGDDIEHLESLLNKHREKLSDEEYVLGSEYLARVKQATMDLYAMKDILTKEFTALQEASTKTKEMGDRFKARLEEFRKLLMMDASDKVITLRSTMVGNIEDVIGHIRQCLGCLTKEVNNDTNLTFGDRNRFLLITREFKMDPSQSLSDELVTVLPTKEEGQDENRLSFVMDNVYGARSPDILTVNVLTVLKKMKAIKKSVGSTSLDIFITDAALMSCGLSQVHLEKKIREEFGVVSARRVIKTVTVAPSASGDAHYEIGGVFNGRVSGNNPNGGFTSTAGMVSGIALSI